MRLSIGILFLIFSISTFAMDEACKNRLQSLMKTKTEKYLFERQSIVIEHFQLNCEETEFGNNLINSGAMVFIHEAAHFEDLNWSEGNMQNSHFNLYTVNGEHIGDYKIEKEIPKPMDLINPYIEINRPSYLTENSVFMSMHNEYLLDSESLASSQLKGIATELNGYTHGTIIQERTSQMIPAEITINDDLGNLHTLKNPMRDFISQLDGMMYFIYNQNLYLTLLRDQHPNLWTSFYNDHNKTFIKRMLLASIDTLKKVNHCSVKDSYYNVQFYIDELKKMDLSIMREVINDEAIMSLLCIQEETVIEEAGQISDKLERVVNSATQNKNCK